MITDNKNIVIWIDSWGEINSKIFEQLKDAGIIVRFDTNQESTHFPNDNVDFYRIAK